MIDVDPNIIQGLDKVSRRTHANSERLVDAVIGDAAGAMGIKWSEPAIPTLAQYAVFLIASAIFTKLAKIRSRCGVGKATAGETLLAVIDDYRKEVAKGVANFEARKRNG